MPVQSAITKQGYGDQREIQHRTQYHGGEDVFRQTGVKTEAGQTKSTQEPEDYVKRHYKVLTSNTIIMSVENWYRGNQGWCAGGRYCWEPIRAFRMRSDEVWRMDYLT